MTTFSRARPFAVPALLSVLAGCASTRAVSHTPPTTSGTVAPVSKTAGLERRDGFIPILLDNKQGKIYLEIPRDSMRALMMTSLATGLGSNPIGLDRGANSDTYVVRFDRNGDRVLAVFENWNYRSSASENSAHQRTVAEAFPPSTAGSLPIISQENGKVVVDATEFFMRDWNDVAGTITANNEGSYSVQRDRSSVYRQYTKAFPENSEIDIALTFATSGRPGNTVASIVPDGHSFTLRQHISLLQLPDAGFKPRKLDPRVGYFDLTFKDYAQPIQLPLEVRWAARHRLDRVNPNDPNSPIKTPIVYYIDRGIPEPVRSATKQGVSWWIDAFNRAGLPGAFRVEDLPEGVDPMDSRYNVVQWENRNERGWSIGGAQTDPRTGEMIKGMARLDSHRARTDYNLYAGLVGADAAAADTAFVLARVRQVSAHEVGHTLGLAHNYIASTYGRGSVMDYPPPRVRLDASGNIDLSSAYAVGPGEYDVFAIHWGYGVFPPGTEDDSLRAIVADGLKRRLLFLSDADARPDYASDPRTNLWDDASTSVEFLRHQSDVRRVALSRFNERNIRTGEPVALLQERFVPVYMLHRFAINSVAKTIGGMEYSNAIRGDYEQATHVIDGATQRRALSALIEALSPKGLAIPDTILTLLGPRPYSYNPYIELFPSRTRPAFDELGAARSLAQLIVDAVLERERAARLVQFYRQGIRQLTLGEVIDSLTADWKAGNSGSLQWDAMRRVKQRAVADRLILLAADKDASPEARAIVELKMSALRSRAKQLAGSGTEDNRAQWMAIAGDFTRWLERQELPSPSPALRPPPGDPFGMER
ncbi:MAG: zinc-dependent metalloprotease [Gemmatimonadaceae bacterium]|nr:zinc-dependent metalloprotease [Gemmatimonadaceae bacterium]